MSDDFKFDDNLVDPSLLVSDSMQTAVDAQRAKSSGRTS